MRRLLKILFITVIYLSFCGKSCTDDTSRIAWEEKQAEMAKDSIRVEFQTENLSEQALRAAEINAIHKLLDLADYINIYTDLSLDTAFRTKAGEMIRGLYLNSDAALSFGEFRNGKMKRLTVGKFLETGFGSDTRHANIVFDSVYVREPLQKSDAEIYTGKLAAKQFITGYLKTDSIVLPAFPVLIEFYSFKENKILGPDTIEVWEVKLGDMK